MTNEQTLNPNITCSYKVAIMLGYSNDNFNSKLNDYAKLHRVNRYIPNISHMWFEREGYVFYHCTQSFHLIWEGEARTLEEAALVEECAQSLLLELGYYAEDESGN